MKTAITNAKRELEQKRREAQERWQAFQEARQKAIEKGVDLAKDEATRKQLDQLHEAYERTAEATEAAESRFMRAIDGEPRGGRLDGIASAFLRSMEGGIAGLKALTTGGSVVPSFFDPQIRELPQRQLFVRSVIPVRQAESDIVHYLRQTVATNLAAPVAAGALKPQSVFTVERVEERVRTVAHVTEPIDRALLADSDELEEFLDGQLRLGVLLAEEAQILNGDAVGENFRGILNTVGIALVTRDTTGGESRSDAIYRAITAVRLAFMEPTAVVLHPTDWQEIRTEKASGTGEYLSGPVVDSDPDRLWGKDVITSPVIALGTGLVGAFEEGATVWEREDAQVTFTESHGDLFQRNQLLWRGEERIAFGVERPQGFCEVADL